MNVLFFLYDDYAEFEISILNTVLRGNGENVVTCGEKPPGEYIISSGGLQIVPHLSINDAEPEKFDALIIPGGRPHLLLGRSDVQAFVRNFHKAGVYIGAFVQAHLS